MMQEINDWAKARSIELTDYKSYQYDHPLPTFAGQKWVRYDVTFEAGIMEGNACIDIPLIENVATIVLNKIDAVLLMRPKVHNAHGFDWKQQHRDRYRPKF